MAEFDSKVLGTEKRSESVSLAEEGSTELTARIIDPAAERALCRQFDFRLLPVLALMYLFNAYVLSSRFLDPRRCRNV